MAVTAEFDPDLPLVAAAQRGDQRAFDDLVRRCDRWIRGIVYGVLGEPDAVDDVSQLVWTAAWQRISDLQDARSWRSWLHRLARNAAFDAGRDASRRKQFAVRVAADGPARRSPASPEEQGMADERNRTVLEAIRALPALYREPFVLRHVENWSYRQIADALDIPVDTVETRLVRARRLLREALDGKI